MSDGGRSVVAVGDYTKIMKKYAKVVVLFVVVGAVLGVVLIGLQTARYTSSSTVQVTPIVTRSDDPNLDTGRQVDTETELLVAGSQRVAERAWALRTAAQDFGNPVYGSDQLKDAADSVVIDIDAVVADLEYLEVTLHHDSQAIMFVATHRDAAKAQAIAQSSAVAYLEHRAKDTTENASGLRQRLEARVEQIESELTELSESIRSFETEDGTVEDPASVRALEYLDTAPRKELEVIAQQLANLEALNINPGLILNDAQLPEESTGLPFLLGPVTGGLLGLAAALVLAFYAAGSDDSLRPERAELSALGAPMLGSAPYRSARSKAATRFYAHNTAGADAYRRLHGTVQFNLATSDKSMVVVSGVNNATAATTVAVNVAAVAAFSGQRTLLIGADLRNAHLGAYTGIGAFEGLSDVVLDGVELNRAVTHVDAVPNLWVLGAGTRRDRPFDVFQRSSFGRLMSAVGADYDLVVIEAPPLLAVADTVDIASYSDGVILVAEGKTDSRTQVSEALSQLRDVGADVIGVVIAESA